MNVMEAVVCDETEKEMEASVEIGDVKIYLSDPFAVYLARRDSSRLKAVCRKAAEMIVEEIEAIDRALYVDPATTTKKKARRRNG